MRRRDFARVFPYRHRCPLGFVATKTLGEKPKIIFIPSGLKDGNDSLFVYNTTIFFSVSWDRASFSGRVDFDIYGGSRPRATLVCAPFPVFVQCCPKDLGAAVDEKDHCSISSSASYALVAADSILPVEVPPATRLMTPMKLTMLFSASLSAAMKRLFQNGVPSAV